MQVEPQNSGNTVFVNASNIISKYRNKQDRLLFCHEKNWWHPAEPGFDSSFFLQVIAGKKKYLPGNFTVKHKLGYFRKGARLDKKYIIEKMQGNAIYGDYVPDGCNPLKLSKDFLLTLVAYVDPSLYKDFYVSYKEELMKKNYNKWSDFTVKINKSIINDVNNFMPMSKNNGNYNGFRLFKNHQQTDVFNRVNNAVIQDNQINEEPKMDEIVDNKIIPQNKNVNIHLIKKK